MLYTLHYRESNFIKAKLTGLDQDSECFKVNFERNVRQFLVRNAEIRTPEKKGIAKGGFLKVYVTNLSQTAN